MSLSTYKIFISPELEKALDKRLPEQLHKTFEKKLDFFRQDRYYPSLNTKKLNVNQQILNQLRVDHVYEFKINDSYRCIFYVIDPKNENEGKIIIYDVGDHDYIIRKFK